MSGLMPGAAVTRANLNELFELADIGYWCREAEGASRGVVVARLIEEPETGEPGQKITLTEGKLRAAFEQLLSEYTVRLDIHQALFQAWLTRTEADGIDMGCIDGEVADVWVQQAAFGRVIYG